MLNYNLSVAVGVGLIALAGLDAEMGVVMLLYLDIAFEEWVKKGQRRNVTELPGLHQALEIDARGMGSDLVFGNQLARERPPLLWLKWSDRIPGVIPTPFPCPWLSFHPSQSI